MMILRVQRPARLAGVKNGTWSERRAASLFQTGEVKERLGQCLSRSTPFTFTHVFEKVRNHSSKQWAVATQPVPDGYDFMASK